MSQWWAELKLPSGATAAAGPATTVATHGSTVKATPAVAQVAAAGHGAVNIAVTGTNAAPTHVRVFARTAKGHSDQQNLRGGDRRSQPGVSARAGITGS